MCLMVTSKRFCTTSDAKLSPPYKHLCLAWPGMKQKHAELAHSMPLVSERDAAGAAFCHWAGCGSGSGSGSPLCQYPVHVRTLAQAHPSCSLLQTRLKLGNARLEGAHLLILGPQRLILGPQLQQQQASASMRSLVCLDPHISSCCLG